jgi:hypothetical protein
MITPLSSGAPGRVHPVVLDRRIRDIARVALSFLITAAFALAITIGLPSSDAPLVLGALLVTVGVVALMVSSRLEVTVALLVVYLLMVNGPVKLLLGAHEATTVIPDVLIVAVCLGAVMRIVVRRERVQLPPLSGWVLTFVGIVLIEAFNPKTEGVLKVLAGFRQQLQFVPFFFFGYYLMRSRQRFRLLFIIVGVAALANGALAAYQTTLSPAQLASWGPGYHNLIFIPAEGTGTGRVYFSGGEARVRPPGLGSEAGFSGGVGAIALPFCLALLSISRRRRWIAIVLCLGALLAIITGLGRTQLIGAGIGVVAFTAWAGIAGGRRMTRPLAALLAVAALGIPAGAFLVSTLHSGTFKRYESINLTSSSTDVHKEGALALIPHDIAASPLGYGLGSVGPAAGIGGRNTQLLEGHTLTSETQFNFIVNEDGAPGLVAWVALSAFMIAFVTRGMRKVRDSDMALVLAGTLAPFIGLFFESTTAAFTTSTAAGPYFWFAIGVAAYWLAGPGLKRLDTSTKSPDARLAIA